MNIVMGKFRDKPACHELLHIPHGTGIQLGTSRSSAIVLCVKHVDGIDIAGRPAFGIE